MTEEVRTIMLGEARVTIINIGELYLPLAPYMNLPETTSTDDEHLRALAAQTLIPIHNVLVELPGLTLLIDAGLYDVISEPEYAIPGYEPPPGLVDRLAERGLIPESITHLIITHRHWDHFNGTTYERDGVYLPRFPNARHYLGRADWERGQTALADPVTVEYRTLRVLHEQGLLEFVEGDRDLSEAVQIIAAPGETPGHQIVRIHSAGETLYCVGDLYHHPVEFAYPQLKVRWANADTIAPSRALLTRRALADNALLLATHIPQLGRLRPTASGVTWESGL